MSVKMALVAAGLPVTAFWIWYVVQEPEENSQLEEEEASRRLSSVQNQNAESDLEIVAV